MLLMAPSAQKWQRVRDNAFHLSRRFTRCQKFPSGRCSHAFPILTFSMKRRLVLSTFAGLLVAGLFLVANFHPALAANEEEDTGYSQISIFAKAVQLLRQDYVD